LVVCDDAQPKDLSLQFQGNEDDEIVWIQDSAGTAFTYVLNTDFIIRHPVSHAFSLRQAITNLDKSFSLVNVVESKLESPKKTSWSSDSVRMINLPNAGGSSLWSEAMSLEVLHRAYGASLAKTEMEIRYYPYGSKITDYSCTLFGHVVGVSVTRAMSFAQQYKRADAQKLLRKKLFGVIMSSQNVLQEDAWVKQILHLFCPNQRIAAIVQDEFNKFPLDLISNTILVVTVSRGIPWLYTDNKLKYQFIDYG